MRLSSLLKATSILLASLALSGCQLVYEVTAAARNGQLVFKTVWKRFGPDQAAAIERFDVVEHSRTSRIVWQIESVAINGTDATELTYGRLPKGFRQKIGPEQLKVGQLYDVLLWGLGGMGETHFVITNGDISDRITTIQSSSSS
jgi:hypothetical protein